VLLVVVGLVVDTIVADVVGVIFGGGTTVSFGCCCCCFAAAAASAAAGDFVVVRGDVCVPIGAGVAVVIAECSIASAVVPVLADTIGSVVAASLGRTLLMLLTQNRQS
jgi:hypothetical protein